MARGPAEIAHGPMLVGTILNVLLYGITLTQTYLYFTSYKRDRTWIKCFVLFLFVADTVQTVFTITYIYTALIKHFGDFPYLTTGNWVFAADPAMTGIIASLVQAFFAWRIKVLTGSILLVTVISLCAVTSLLMGVATAIAIGIVPQFVQFQKFRVVVIIWLVAASFADMLITSSLVFHLRRHRTGFSTTDGHIDRIIRMTVQTGLITAIWAVVDLLVYLLDSTGTHLTFNFCLSKLYTNSLMSSLNARGGWKYNDNTQSGQKSIGGRAPDVVQLATRPEVFVHVESHEMVDASNSKGQEDFVDTETSDWAMNSKPNAGWCL